ncbi:MAG: hypothetical protein COA39_000125 [Sulfurimonas sp.]|nr:hypothetical protein [Sulfurimonas sp.]
MSDEFDDMQNPNDDAISEAVSKTELPKDIEKEMPIKEEANIELAEKKALPKQKEKKVEQVESDFLNINTSRQFLDALTYASLSLESSIKELNDYEGLGDIKKHLESLKDISIDTSSFEKQFEIALKTLQNKIEITTDKVDLNELDEISSKLTIINKKIKKHRLFGFILVSVFAFASGFVAHLILNEREASQHLTASEISIIEEFKNSHRIRIGSDKKKGVKYILLKSKLVNSGKYKAIIIQQKQGK